MKAVKIIFLLCILGNTIFNGMTYRYINRLQHYLKFYQAKNDCTDRKAEWLQNAMFLAWNGLRPSDQGKIHRSPSPYDYMQTDNLGVYDLAIPECRLYHSRFTCYHLDAQDDVSIDACGPRFGFSEDEIKKLHETHKLFLPNKGWFNKEGGE